MTGVEAVSNGVSAFRDPSVKHAHRTLVAIVLALCCRRYRSSLAPITSGDGSDPTRLSERAVPTDRRRDWPRRRLLHRDGHVLAVLCLSANTSFVGFPDCAAWSPWTGSCRANSPFPAAARQFGRRRLARPRRGRASHRLRRDYRSADPVVRGWRVPRLHAVASRHDGPLVAAEARGRGRLWPPRTDGDQRDRRHRDRRQPRRHPRRQIRRGRLDHRARDPLLCCSRRSSGITIGSSGNSSSARRLQFHDDQPPLVIVPVRDWDRLAEKRWATRCGCPQVVAVHLTDLVAPTAGSIRFPRRGELLGLPAHRIVEEGVATVTENRHLFGSMSVMENLVLGAYPRRARDAAPAGLARASSSVSALGRASPSGGPHP